MEDVLQIFYTNRKLGCKDVRRVRMVTHAKITFDVSILNDRIFECSLMNIDKIVLPEHHM